MNRYYALTICLVFSASAYASQTEELVLQKVDVSSVRYQGRDAVRVVEASMSADEDKLAILDAADMTNGTISAYVSGNVRDGAGAQARGFVGIAFRINADVSSFEAIYLRPVNARAEDQLSRNHSIQYISFPDYPWHRLRRETPGRYESYADMIPGEWIHFCLEIHGQVARLYLNGSDQPALVVNDLKLGERSGRLGLWIGPGTEAYFSDIAINPD